jgi:branched-chain amino acid transport system permease protein
MVVIPLKVQLENHMNVKKYNFPVLFILALFVLPFFFSSSVLLHVLILVYFYAFLSMSWNILGGFAGQLSLGHAAYTAIGAYVSTMLFLRWHISPWITMFGGGIGASIMSVIIGYPCFKLRGAYYALSTLAFAELVRVLITNTDSFLGFQINAARGLLLPVMGHAPGYFQFVDKQYYYYIILSFCTILTIILYFMNKFRFGYYLAAIREDQEAAEALGINVTWCKLLAGIMSSFFTAIGGVFYAQYVLYISAQSIGALHISLEMAFISIVGGKGTIIGPIIGAFLLTPLAELTRVYLAGTYMGIHLVFYGGVLMLVVKFMPSGIIHPLRMLYEKIITP